jgi:peptidoglycan/LPS O-acetylase OafA/YrhL
MSLRQNNNFDFIRFLAALIVILAHSNYLLNPNAKDLLIKYFNIGIRLPELGVAIFFVISGYLISKSVLSSSSVVNYIWKRSLRIFPGLFVALLFSVFVLGPILTDSKISDYFTSKNTFKYLFNITLYKTYGRLENVFSTFECKTFNGSLWTLAYEFSFYMLSILLIPLAKLKVMTKYVILLLLIFCLILRMYIGDNIVWYDYSSPMLLGLKISSFFTFGIYFLSGALFYFFENEIKNNSTLVIIVLSITISLLLLLQMKAIIAHLLVPLSVFSISFMKGRLNSFGQMGDFSYGMYIYAYPIQQTIIYFLGNEMNILTHFLLSFIMTMPFAIFSWNFIEKRALSFKNLF